MELQKNTLPLPLQEISQSELVSNLAVNNYGANVAPRSIAEAVKLGQPISVVSKISGAQAVCNQLEFDLIKAMSLLNLNLTIKEHQYPAIVKELIETFPHESIQDFQLCFKNGVTGKYGKIYNVDLSVLAMWMGEYLEEKYTYLERQTLVEQSKYEFAQDEAIDNLIEKTTETLTNEPDKKIINKAEMLRDKIVGSLSEAEIKAEGQEKPKRPTYVPPPKEYVIDLELRREWGRLYHDPITGKPKEGWVSFEEWKNK